jgi:DNA-binding transcriptional LysR family regulator
VRPRLCASPAYLEQRGTPEHPRELAAHGCLVFRPGGGIWVFQSPRGLVHVEAAGRLTADDNHTLLGSAIMGRGIALLPHYVCGDALADGRLVELLPGFPPQDSWFKAYVPRRRYRMARVRALVDWLAMQLDAG